MKVTNRFNVREDYYARLDLTPSANLNEIKRSYRRLALRTHPDVNKEPNAADVFKKVCEAYKVLSDPDVRRQYDVARGLNRNDWASRGAAAGSSASTRSGTSGSNYRTARQWYDQYNSGASAETAESIDDSFSKIFKDLVDTVVDKGGKAIFEDFVDWMERGVDGVGAESDAVFEDLLRSENLAEIQTETETLQFLISKLRERLQKAQLERMLVDSELRTIDSMVRDIGAVDRRLQVVEKAASVKARIADLESHIKRADRRQRRLALRAEEIRWGPGGRRPAYEKYRNPRAQGSASSRYRTSSEDGTESSSNSSGSAGSAWTSRSAADAADRRQVEAELARLKRDMGL